MKTNRPPAVLLVIALALAACSPAAEPTTTAVPTTTTTTVATTSTSTLPEATVSVDLVDAPAGLDVAVLDLYAYAEFLAQTALVQMSRRGTPTVYSVSSSEQTTTWRSPLP